MERSINKELIKWKTNPYRMPLIIRGARQVGKSYCIKEFGKNNFENIVIANFEKNKDIHKCFNTLDPQKIITELEIIFNIKIIPGKTLLFLDEIQECSQALNALRYFKEEMNELHVIAAGSLLEFIIHDKNFSFPVGRVEFMYLKPLSFQEFLKALNKDLLLEKLKTSSFINPLEESIHSLLLDLLKTYFLIGGMPLVVDCYINTKSIFECMKIQENILIAYENDFGKYASKTEYKYLKICYQNIAQFVAKHVKYSKIDPSVNNPSRDFKHAIETLNCISIIHQIFQTSANGIPLKAEINHKKFKLLFLDIGLYQRSMKIDAASVMQNDIMQINKGVLAEQFVGQELLAYSDHFNYRNLFFWQKENPSNAEIDFVLSYNSDIVPIEVKSGKTGRFKSLQEFMKIKNIQTGLKISTKPLINHQKIINIPLYMVNEIPRLLKDLKKDS
jgi:uncharacterized protein